MINVQINSVDSIGLIERTLFPILMNKLFNAIIDDLKGKKSTIDAVN